MPSHSAPRSSPTLTIMVQGGVVSEVYSTTKDVIIKVLDLDGNDDMEAADAARAKVEAIRERTRKGKLVIVA